MVKGTGKAHAQSMRGFEIVESDAPLLEAMPIPFERAITSWSTTVSYGELAQALGITVGTLKSRLNRARAMLIRMRAVATIPDLSPEERAKAMKKAKTHVDMRKPRAA